MPVPTIAPRSRKADLAVNVSVRLPGNWLPDPLRIGAFDMPEQPDTDEADTVEDGECDEDANEMA